ncbi:hypothetical protein [Bosea sp. TAF32]|uniref:hypothetical protein n=1 Tax=Bosea sp. TAF32 TaxID=3237482 RepID=UPI003F8E2CF6
MNTTIHLKFTYAYELLEIVAAYLAMVEEPVFPAAIEEPSFFSCGHHDPGILELTVSEADRAKFEEKFASRLIDYPKLLADLEVQRAVMWQRFEEDRKAREAELMAPGCGDPAYHHALDREWSVRRQED